VQHRIETSTALLTTNDELCNILLDAETGQRGYLLTGSEDYLEPYHRSRANLPLVVAVLDKLPLDPDQAKFREEVEPVMLSKMNELARTIVLRREAGFADAAAVVMTGEGKAEMDRLRSMFREARTRTEGKIDGLRRIATSMVRGILTGLAFAVLGLIALFVRATPKAREVAPTEPFSAI
jgi:CHASE3 domain sensor protein